MENETYLVEHVDGNKHWIATGDQVLDYITFFGRCEVVALEVTYSNEEEPPVIYTYTIPATYDDDAGIGWSKSLDIAQKYGKNILKWVYDCHQWIGTAEEQL